MALHDLYHGARANKLLFNIRNGSITADSSGKIYFAEREWRNCFVHGADLETGESYSRELWKAFHTRIMSTCAPATGRARRLTITDLPAPVSL